MTYGELFIALLSIGALAGMLITIATLLILKLISNDEEREQ